MRYINDIPILFIIITLILYIPVRIFYAKRSKVKLYKEFIYILLIIYSESLIYLTIFPSDSVGATGKVAINIVPFQTIYQYILYQKNISLLLINLLGNVVVFVPIGIFLLLLKPNITIIKVSLIGFLCTWFIETTQLSLTFVGVLSRSFDIDDLILNTLGVIIGYALARGLSLFAKRM